MKPRTGIRIMLAAALAAGLAAAAGARDAESPGYRIDPLVKDQLDRTGQADLFVKMRSEADLSAAYLHPTKAGRAWYVHDTLLAQADRTQAGVRALLAARGAAFEVFWINNSLFVRDAGRELVEALAARPEVAYVRGDHEVELIRPLRVVEAPEFAAAIEWNIDKVNAPDVWATGNRGEGQVVANVDTGVRWTHNALQPHYRGRDGNHDYDWWDPDHTRLTPSDATGHGTHTMGTMVGDDGGSNQIGMAPGAEWIASQGCDSNSCSDFDLTSSAQWIACPTKVDGTAPDCSKIPDSVNNSWAGGGGDPWYQSYVDSWVSAGILPAFAIGNSGSNCNTSQSPGDYRNVLGVGATTNTDVLASFSSKGPGAFRKNKPDIVAPGQGVRSSYYTSDSAYTFLDGTSMATPHIAGAVALIKAANPALSPVEVAQAMVFNTVTALGAPPGPDSCGGTNYNVFPNPIYGFGRLDVAAAVAAVAPPPQR